MIKLINNLKNQFSFDWQNNRKILYLEFCSTFLTLAGGSTLAILGKSSNLYFVFTAYFLGSVAMFAAAKLRNNVFYLLLSVGYLIINGLGIYRLLGN